VKDSQSDQPVLWTPFQVQNCFKTSFFSLLVAWFSFPLCLLSHQSFQIKVIFLHNTQHKVSPIPPPIVNPFPWICRPLRTVDALPNLAKPPYQRPRPPKLFLPPSPCLSIRDNRHASIFGCLVSLSCHLRVDIAPFKEVFFYFSPPFFLRFFLPALSPPPRKPSLCLLCRQIIFPKHPG